MSAIKSWIFCLLLACTSLPSFAACDLEGAGTHESPYLIKTYADLKKIKPGSCPMSGVYHQLAHIVANTDEQLAGGTPDVFTPIGYCVTQECWQSASPRVPGGPPPGTFTGTYKGNGFTVKGLVVDNNNTASYPKIDMIETSGAGMFGTIEGAWLEKVNVIGGSIRSRGGGGAGGLVGEAFNSKIIDCTANISVYGDGNWMSGGLVGYSNRSRYERSRALGDVENSNTVGGFAGASYGDAFFNNYADGGVTGNTYVGGFVGRFMDPNNMQASAIDASSGIHYCYSHNRFVRIVKQISTQNSKWSSICSTTGYNYEIIEKWFEDATEVPAPAPRYCSDLDRFYNDGNYWTRNGIGVPLLISFTPNVYVKPLPYTKVYDGKPIDAADLRYTIGGFDYSLVLGTPPWDPSYKNAVEPGVYKLSMNPATSEAGTGFYSVRNGYWFSYYDASTITIQGKPDLCPLWKTGITEGSEALPFRIASMADVESMKNPHCDTTAHYRLVADIEANTPEQMLAGTVDTFFTTDRNFAGYWHGGGHTISGLFIWPNAAGGSGFLGEGRAALIDSFHIRRSIVASGANGGLFQAGKAGNAVAGSRASILRHSSAEGTVRTSGNAFGLIMYADIVEGCSFQGTVQGTYAFGLVIGARTIRQNSVHATVQGSENSAGVASYAKKFDQNSFHGAVLGGTGYTGGLVASPGGGGEISNSYAILDSIQGTGYVGGLIGRHWPADSVVYNCYAKGPIKTGAADAGGLFGLFTAREKSRKYRLENLFWDNTGTNPQSAFGINYHGYSAFDASNHGTDSAGLVKRETFAAWDFVDSQTDGTEDIWDMDSTTNQGMPFLSWERPRLKVPAQVVQIEKEYDGTTVAPVETGTPAGVKGSDAVSVVAHGEFDTKELGRDKPIAIRYSLAGSAAAGYLPPFATGATGSIVPRKLRVSATFEDKTYDGTDAVTLRSASIVNPVEGEGLQLTLAGYRFSDAAAGEQKEIAAQVSIAADVPERFTYEPVFLGSATIAPAPLRVSVGDLRLALGAEFPAFEFSFTGFLGQDDASQVTGLTAEASCGACTEPGIFAIIPRGGVARNYVLEYGNGVLNLESPARLLGQPSPFAPGASSLRYDLLGRLRP